MTAPSFERWAWAEVDLGAVAHNVDVVLRASDGAEVWAVVKADGYGHGAVRVAEAALGAGASGLCVALTQEAVQLRTAGVSAPILLLSQQPSAHAATIVAHGLVPTVYDAASVDALAAAAETADTTLDVHVKVDTGMQRVGVRPDAAAELVDRIRSSPSLRLAGVYTHLAVADSDLVEHRDVTADQLGRLDEVLDRLRIDADVLVHAANSAGALAHPAARRRIVRPGIALYGISPGDGVDDLAADLRPALSLRCRISFVKTVRAGTGISYGLRHVFDRDTTVATLPIGYADGVPRRLGSVGGEVLVAGRRCPIVGVVTMDQLMVDVGAVVDAGETVAVGDEAVLLGSDGGETVRAEEWARRLDTIGYEIVCGISARVARRHVPATP